MSTMFTMTIQDAGQAVVTRGQSRTDETWDQTLLRLYHDSLPPGSPRRRISFAKRRAGQDGGATNAVIVGYQDDSGFDVSDQVLFVHTEPPQF